MPWVIGDDGELTDTGRAGSTILWACRVAGLETRPTYKRAAEMPWFWCDTLNDVLSPFSACSPWHVFAPAYQAISVRAGRPRAAAPLAPSRCLLW